MSFRFVEIKSIPGTFVGVRDAKHWETYSERLVSLGGKDFWSSIENVSLHGFLLKHTDHLRYQPNRVRVFKIWSLPSDMFLRYKWWVDTELLSFWGSILGQYQDGAFLFSINPLDLQFFITLKIWAKSWWS